MFKDRKSWALVVCACNLSTGEAEARGSRVQGKPGLPIKILSEKNGKKIVINTQFPYQQDKNRREKTCFTCDMCLARQNGDELSFLPSFCYVQCIIYHIHASCHIRVPYITCMHHGIDIIYMYYISYTCSSYIVHTYSNAHITSHKCSLYIQCIYAMYSYSAHMYSTYAVHACSEQYSAYMQCTQDYLSVLCEWACLCKLSSETMRTLKVFPDFWHETETILGVRNLMSNQLWYMP